jgi:hypothetical protein
MSRQMVLLMVLFLLLSWAALASAAGFNVANYTCTNLGGVPRTFSPSNPEMNFMAYSLSEQGQISGVGYWADIGGGGPPTINQEVLLQCGYAGFGPASFSGGPYGVAPIVSNNSYYDNSGMPTSGTHWNTGLAFDNDRLKSFVGNDSGKFVFSGSGGVPGGGGSMTAGGHLWTSGSYTSPSALSSLGNGWINDNGLVVGGDGGNFGGWGTGVAYDSNTNTTLATFAGPALYVNNAGQVTGCNYNGGIGTAGYVWNQGATTYWGAGTTSLASAGVLSAQSISQSGRYVAAFGGTTSSTTGVLYDAASRSVVQSIAGEAYAVNNNGWMGGDTETDWLGNFDGTAWLWDGTTQHDLDAEIHARFPSTSAYTICAVWGINNSSQILVWGLQTGTDAMESFLLNGNPGDANIDGKVDIGDLSKVLTSYDKTGMTWGDGDFNGDGSVNISDLSVVLTNYDHTYSSGAAGIKAVPEPSMLVLAVGGIVALLAYAWRKRT